MVTNTPRQLANQWIARWWLYEWLTARRKDRGLVADCPATRPGDNRCAILHHVGYQFDILGIIDTAAMQRMNGFAGGGSQNHSHFHQGMWTVASGRRCRAWSLVSSNESDETVAGILGVMGSQQGEPDGLPWSGRQTSKIIDGVIRFFFGNSSGDNAGLTRCNSDQVRHVS